MPLLFLHFSLQSCSMVPVSALLIFLPIAWTCLPQKAGNIDAYYPLLYWHTDWMKETLLWWCFGFRLCHSVVFPQCHHRQHSRVSLWLGDRPAVPWWCVLHWDSQPGVLPLHHLRPDAQKPLILRHAVWGESFRFRGFRMILSFSKTRFMPYSYWRSCMCVILHSTCSAKTPNTSSLTPLCPMTLC